MRGPDAIIIAIGTNDASYLKSKDGNYVSSHDFEANLEKIIEKGKKYTDEIIFIGLTKANEAMVAPTPWVPDFHYRNADMKIYDNKIKEVCKKNNLKFIEMMNLLKDEDLEDGLHPNSAGHEKMFLRIKNFLEENTII